MVVDDGLRVDAEGVVDRREQFGGVHGVALRGGGGLVGLAVDVAALDAGAADDARVAIRPVVAAVGTVVVAAGADAAFRAAAEFAEGDDEGFAEEAALVEVFKERAQALIEHGAGFALHAFGEALVVVPGVVVGVGDLGPDDLDDARAGFDEAAGEEEALAKGVAAVAVAEFFALGGEVEGCAGAAGDDEVEGALIIFVEVVVRGRFLDVGHGGFDGLAEFGAAFEAQREDLLRELEVLGFEAIHFRHVEVVAFGVEGVGVEGFAEEAGGAALADDVGFLERAREHDEREHRRIDGFESHDIGAEVGEIFRVGRLELAGGADLVGRVAGHDLVDRGGVVEEPVGGVAHRADHGELVVHLRHLRDDFGEVGTGDFRRDGLERAADFVGDVFLGIPEVEVRGAALEVNHNDALGFAPAGAAAGGGGGGRGGDGGGGGAGVELEHLAEGEAEDAGAAEPQEVAARELGVGVAEVGIETTGESDHGGKGVGERKRGRGGEGDEGVLNRLQAGLLPRRRLTLERHLDLAVKEEGGVVDDGPGEVLGAGEALVGELGGAERGVGAELGEFGVEGDGLLGGGEGGFEVAEFGVFGNGEPGGEEGLLLFEEAGVGGAVIRGERGVVGGGALGGGDLQGGDDVGGETELEGSGGGGGPEAEAADGEIFAELLLEEEIERGAVGAADGGGEGEAGVVRFAVFFRNAPAVAGAVGLAVDGGFDVEFGLGEIGAGVREGGFDGGALAAFFGPFEREFGEDEIAGGAAGPEGGQAFVGEDFEQNAGDAGEFGFGGDIVADEVGGGAGGEVGAVGELGEFVEVVGGGLGDFERDPGGAEAGGVERGLPRGELGGEGGFGGGEGGGCGGDFFFPFLRGGGGLRGDLDGAGGDGGGRGGDGLLALFLFLGIEGGPPGFAFGEGGGELGVLAADGLPGGERGVGFLGRGVAVEGAEENFVDEGAVVGGGGGEAGEFVFRVVDGAGNGRAGEEGHNGTEAEVAAAFAFAGGFADGAAEAGEETAGDIDGGVGELGGARAGFHAGEIRDGAGDAEDGVEEDLGGEPAGHGVGIVGAVVGVPLVGGEGELVGARLHDGALEVADVEAALDELLGEPGEEFGIGGRIAGADIVDRVDEADAEEVAPHAVHIAQGEVAVVGGGYPIGEGFAAGGGGGSGRGR